MILQDKQLERCLIKDLKETLENVIYELLGHSKINLRWVNCYFPFTEPSFEMEICINGDWVEVLGSGTWLTEVIFEVFCIKKSWTKPTKSRRIISAGLQDSASKESPCFSSKFQTFGYSGLKTRDSFLNLHPAKSLPSSLFPNILHVTRIFHFGWVYKNY